MRLLLIMLLCGQVLPATAQAQRDADAEARAGALLSEFKESGDPTVILEYVDWEHAFRDLRASERVRMGVSTPRELHIHIRSALEQEHSGHVPSESVHYRITGSTRVGDRVTVFFDAVRGAEVRSQQLEFILRSGDWYLPSPELRLSGPSSAAPRPPR